MAVSNAADQAIDASVIAIDRRSSDRRQDKNPNATESGGTNPPRRKKQRRRHIDPTTCERDYNIDEIEFMRAMDDYKRDSGRMFPTCSEVLEVIRALGYVKLSDEQAAQFRVDASECDSYSDDGADLGEPINS
jgi:hypothetical protein